jgi:hypothetical protein
LIDLSGVDVDGLGNPPNTDLALALTSARDVVRGLHPHQRVHSHPECLFNAKGHIAGEIGFAIQ